MLNFIEHNGISTASTKNLTNKLALVKFHGNFDEQQDVLRSLISEKYHLQLSIPNSVFGESVVFFDNKSMFVAVKASEVDFISYLINQKCKIESYSILKISSPIMDTEIDGFIDLAKDGMSNSVIIQLSRNPELCTRDCISEILSSFDTNTYRFCEGNVLNKSIADFSHKLDLAKMQVLNNLSSAISA
ncbi:hypothetical protein C9J27_05635 [Photobacterium kishitanii]|uniref:Uncharacterized protein n=1 Tax=Photobacterium kishitanii TaxID=318456 RepID=A0A2T3KLN2_9GAMM|nr:hypothetical protein C9J27_05635 [Photobacterium kishitanii]